jgi:hypothetical protein
VPAALGAGGSWADGWEGREGGEAREGGGHEGHVDEAETYQVQVRQYDTWPVTCGAPCPAQGTCVLRV